MSSLSDHVVLTITQDAIGISRAGFGTPLILSCNAAFAERVRFYSDLPSVADDFATTAPEYLAARAIFSQSPHPELIAIGRAAGKPTQKYRVDIATVELGRTYTLVVSGEGVTKTTVSYTTLEDLTFADGDITAGTDVIALADHGMESGDGPFRVSNSGGALPTGLSVDTNYWVIAVDEDNIKLAASKANALTNTAVDISAASGGGTHTLRRNQNDVIIAQLVQGLNAVTGKNFTAVQTAGSGETDYLEATGDDAGEWFSLEASVIGSLKIEQTHAEPATPLATDLDAINLENSNWYALVTLYNSDAYVKAAAAWVEAASTPKLYACDLSNSETVTLADGGGDTADDLQELGYARTFTCYHPDPSAMFGAAWLGRVLPLDPGSETWKFKTLSGVEAVTTTATHRVNLRAKKCNTYQTVAGRNITWEGNTVDGDFIDVTRGIDWLEDDMTKGVFGVLAGANKIPYTNAGIAMIEKEVRASLNRAIAQGLISDDPVPVVTVPRAGNVSAANKAARLLPDVKFSATLQGAVHKVQLSGVVSV